MRKFTQAMLVLLAFLGSTIGAVAQNYYPVNVSTTETRNPNNSNRNYSGITLQPERGTIQTINIGDNVYCDMTSSGESGTFKIKAGASAYPRFVINNNQWDGSWMHSFIFVDSDKDGQFQVNGLDSEDELYAHFGIKTTKDGNPPMINSTQSFSVPQTPGTYRMRYLVAWETNTSRPDPAGNNSDGNRNTLNYNGGVIVDVNLKVEYPTITTVVSGAEAEVTYSGNPICGQDFTFTAPNKFGFTKTVTVKCGENFDDAQATSTVSYYNNSSSETPVDCYNWEQFTPTDNGDGTYTVPADKMKGDLQITVTYTKDVMALIKAGKQVFRLKNRAYYTTSPYLKVAKSDVTGTIRDYKKGDAILYHVNETMANEAGASCLWRLIPVSGSNNQYYLRSQNANASDLHNGDDYPIKMTERGSALYLVQSGSYYGLGTSSSTSDKVFLHAVAYGMSNSDGNGKYVDTSNGDYVTTWNLSENASQWTFEAVDEIGITIGTSGYASVNYDFPVKFPAGVKVYKKAQETATYIRLEEIPAGDDDCVSLPTGNAAFVAGTEGASITLSILSDEPDNIDTGVNGTYLATKFEEDDAANIYGIAKVNDVVAFYKMRGGSTIKQNKGYIRSTSSKAPRMELTFGEGETTGIESMLEDNSRRESIDTSVLYDLNGRRVLYPSRGIYVTAGGQRIFLK